MADADCFKKSQSGNRLGHGSSSLFPAVNPKHYVKHEPVAESHGEHKPLVVVFTLLLAYSLFIATSLLCNNKHALE